MAKFLTPLQFEDERGFPLRLLAPLVYQSDKLGDPITVPTGFETDLASIPRPLWNILPPIGKADRAAVVHDFLYQTAWHGINRSTADAIFNEAMQVVGVGRFARWTIYSGVRIGGWKTWNRYRSEESAGV